MENYGQLIDRAVLAFPEKRAVVCERSGSEICLTFADLNDLINEIEAEFRKSGLKRGHAAAIAVRGGPELIASTIASSRLGLRFCVLNPDESGERLTSMLIDVQATAIVRDVIDDAVGGIRRVEVSILSFKKSETIEERHASCIMFTSGTTGNPKPVRKTNEEMLYDIRKVYELPDSRFFMSDKVIICTPLFHEAAFSLVRNTLSRSGEVVFLEKFDAHNFKKLVYHNKCLTSLIVPAMIKSILESSIVDEGKCLQSLRRIIVGGSYLEEILAEALRQILPKVVVVSYYGTTEVGAVFSTFGIDLPAGCAGRILPGVDVKLIDEIDNCGELAVKSVVKRCAAEGGFIATGDFFRRDDKGHYYFLGRRDDRIDCGSEKIFPIEVEKILLENCNVKEACVVGARHENKGMVPVGIVVPRDDQSNEIELMELANLNLPKYAHLRNLKIVEKIPRNAAGKPDRRAILRMFCEEATC